MADIPFPTNLMPQYQSPQAMALSAAQTQNTRADAAMTQSLAAGQDITNQSSALKLGLLQSYLQQQPASTPAPAQPANDSQIGSTGANPDDVTQHAFSQYAPMPTARPPSVTAQMGRASLAGLPEVAANIGAQYDAQVQGANQQRALAANNAYQSAETVASAPSGAAFETLSRLNPQAAASLKQKYANDTPEQLDQDVRLYAQHIGIATHQYAGRESEFQNGVLVDKKDGKPVLGSEQVLTGLDAGGKEKAFASANEPVTVGDQLPRPRWQTAGFQSAEAYVIAADKAARGSAANAPPMAAGNAPPAAATPRSSAAPAGSPVADPALKVALADHDYDQKSLPTPKTQEDLKSNNDLRAATNTARTDLLSDAKEATNAGSQAIQYLSAARAIMDSKGAPLTGAVGNLWAKVGGAFGTVDATNYQEAAKYLGNAAIQAGKGNFGKGMTQNDVTLQKEELSPSVHMTDAALKDLLDAGIKNTQYTMDSSKRVGAYLSSGKDPQQFAQWNDKYFNRSATVNKPTTPTGPGGAAEGATSLSKSGKPIMFANGHWQYK